MRSVIVFALFAFAICQSPLDIVTGFTNQLALSNAQTGDFNNCVSGLFAELQALAPVYTDYVNHNFDSLVADGASYLDNFEAAVQTACLPVLADLENYAMTFGNGQSPKTNFELNGAYVAQQVALLVQYAATKNFTSIGSTFGYIFQIAVGSVDLPSLLPQQLTNDQYMTIYQNSLKLNTNQDGAFTQYIQAFIDELGLTNQVNTTALVDLVFNAETFGTTIENFKQSLQNGTFDSDITAIENFVTEVLETVRANKQGLEAIVTIDAPYFEQFIHNPVGYTARVIYNVLLNAPTIEGMNAQIEQDLLNGDFAAIGQNAGEIANAIYAF